MNSETNTPKPRMSQGRQKGSNGRYQPSKKGKTIAVLLIATCIGIISYSYRELRADILFWDAHYMQKRWAASGEYPPLEEIAEAQQIYHKALKWVPGYPAYHDSLAYLSRLEMPLTTDPVEYERLGRESIANNKAALENRPIWPASYSQMTIVKSLIGEFDAEWLEFYRTAFELGPWEEINLLQIAEAGLMRWPFLEAVDQDITVTAMLRVLQYNRGHSAYLRYVMDTYARTIIVCNLLEERDAKLPESGASFPANLCN